MIEIYMIISEVLFNYTRFYKDKIHYHLRNLTIIDEFPNLKL